MSGRTTQEDAMPYLKIQTNREIAEDTKQEFLRMRKELNRWTNSRV